jgi:hypothetical protein
LSRVNTGADPGISFNEPVSRLSISGLLNKKEVLIGKYKTVFR